MALVRLMYVSASIGELSEAVLDQILASSIRHNQGQGVTGMLVYAEENFMQVLEGEAEAVDETYERICRDARHHLIYLLSRETITERQFAKWSMAFRRLTPSDLANWPAYAPLFSHGFDAQALGEQPGWALDMLLHFANQHKLR